MRVTTNTLSWWLMFFPSKAAEIRVSSALRSRLYVWFGTFGRTPFCFACRRWQSDRAQCLRLPSIPRAIFVRPFYSYSQKKSEFIIYWDQSSSSNFTNPNITNTSGENQVGPVHKRWEPIEGWLWGSELTISVIITVIWQGLIHHEIASTFNNYNKPHFNNNHHNQNYLRIAFFFFFMRSSF